ncbi:MAG: hypothetical protein HC888_02055 [Candidatus Competibacteraceae bacterium]|nr:hypothetical protein [Candidatus Competibacteraceae bacterium]
MPQLEWRGKNTWRQISTNVPPETLSALRKLISKHDSNMSQLLREIIDESPVIKYGNLPQPTWASHLSENIASLRTEIAELRSAVAALQPPEPQPQVLPSPDGDTLASELSSDIAQLRQEMLFVHSGTKANLLEFEELTAPSVQPELIPSPAPSFLGRFTQLFQRKRPTSPTNLEPLPGAQTPDLLEVG